MNRSPLALDFVVGPLRSSPVLGDDYLMQNGGYGDGQHQNLFDNHLHDQSPDLPSSTVGDVHLEHDYFDHDSDPDPDWDIDNDNDNDNDSQPPSRASPPSSSRSFPFSPVPSPSPSPGSLFNSDSAPDLQVDADLSLASGSNPGSDPSSDPDSGPGSDSDVDLDSGQDTDPVASGSSPSSPNPDPLVDRPRHHLQSNDINYHNLALYRHARASQTADIHPNRGLPAPPARHHHHLRPHHHLLQHHRHRHHHRQALPLDNNSSRTSRQIANLTFA